METFVILVLVAVGVGYWLYRSGMYASIRDTVSRLWMM